MTMDLPESWSIEPKLSMSSWTSRIGDLVPSVSLECVMLAGWAKAEPWSSFKTTWLIHDRGDSDKKNSTTFTRTSGRSGRSQCRTALMILVRLHMSSSFLFCPFIGGFCLWQNWNHLLINIDCLIVGVYYGVIRIAELSYIFSHPPSTMCVRCTGFLE